ncbi:hypothetical protein KAR91_38055 [Candidatus Pacearchaeota archaeon]|nr:hypothetical protein [Candidatus Pacearchaeota archaeon]
MKKVILTKKEDELWFHEADKPWHKPGCVFLLVFRTPEKPKQEAILPAIILNTHIHHLRPPTHDVGFFTSWLSGEVSGMLTIQDMMPSRYISKKIDITKNELKIFENFSSDEYMLKPQNLFYEKVVSKTEKHLIYPFADEDQKLQETK